MSDLLKKYSTIVEAMNGRGLGEDEVAEEMVKYLLVYFGVDAQAEALNKIAVQYLDYMRRCNKKPTFEMETVDSRHDEMIVISDIQFYSLCNCHLVPFFGKATVAYLPDKKVVQPDKLAEAVQCFTSGACSQAAGTIAIADALENGLKPLGVGVILKAQHLCVAMADKATGDALTTTSRLTGVIRDKPEARAELMTFVR